MLNAHVRPTEDSAGGRRRSVVGRLPQSAGRQRPEGDLGGLLVAVPRVGDRHLVAGGVRPDGGGEVGGVDDLVSSTLVTTSPSCRPASAAGLPLLDADQQGAVVGVADLHAEVGVGDLAVVDQLVGDVAGVVDRDGEADADVARLGARRAAAGRRGDGGVDADDLAVGVDQGAPELPGLMAASVWMASTTAVGLEDCCRARRATAAARRPG